MGTLGQGVGAWGALTLELNLEDGEGRSTSVMEQGCQVVLLSNRPRSKEGEFLGVLGLWWKPHSCFLASHPSLWGRSFRMGGRALS